MLHHVRNNGVRFLKFDGGNYACNDLAHGHLPGKYATERMHDMLIELADAARAEAPDVFVMWYWGLRSPFWACTGTPSSSPGSSWKDRARAPCPRCTTAIR